MDAFFKKTNQIKEDLAFVSEATKRVTLIREDAVGATSSSKESEASSKLSDELRAANKKCDSAKRLLAEIDKETKQMGSQPNLQSFGYGGTCTQHLRRNLLKWSEFTRARSWSTRPRYRKKWLDRCVLSNPMRLLRRSTRF